MKPWFKDWQARGMAGAASGALAGWLMMHGTALAQQPRFVVSDDQQEVTDTRTGLVWQRCAEGMELRSKSCAGSAMQIPHTLAVSRAAEAAKRTGKPWRLPTIKELSSIANPTMADPGANVAAIDVTLFPSTPPIRFWTSSSAGPHYFMYVGFASGDAGENGRSMPAALRLVRSPK